MKERPSEWGGTAVSEAKQVGACVREKCRQGCRSSAQRVCVRRERKKRGGKGLSARVRNTRSS